MNLTKLKELVDKLYEDEGNRTKKVVVSCGYDDLCYTGEATSVSKSVWNDNGDCFDEEYDAEGESERVIEISGWAD
jgi:hypothetical protein